LALGDSGRRLQGFKRGVVEVVDDRRGTGSTGEGLQRRDDELGGNLGFELEYVQKSGARQLYL
jgi:hypothetical protein